MWRRLWWGICSCRHLSTSLSIPPPSVRTHTLHTHFAHTLCTHTHTHAHTHAHTHTHKHTHTHTQSTHLFAGWLADSSLHDISSALGPPSLNHDLEYVESRSHTRAHTHTHTHAYTRTHTHTHAELFLPLPLTTTLMPQSACSGFMDVLADLRDSTILSLAHMCTRTHHRYCEAAATILWTAALTLPSRLVRCSHTF